MRRPLLEKLECRRLLSGSPGLGEDQILVRFLDGAESHVGTLASEIVRGASVARDFSVVPGLRQIQLPDGVNVEAALQAYRNNPGVLYAEPNYRLQVADLPSDPRFDQLWGLQNSGQTGGLVDADIDAPEAWQISTGVGRTVVAVIDTGVDYTHEDLAGNMWTNSRELDGTAGVDDDGNGFVDDVYGYDFANDDGDPMDDNRHGTHVAGIIGAVGDNGLGVAGVNWDIQIMAVKAFAADGSATTSDAIDAINYAVAQGALISNSSWGGNEPFSRAMYDAIAAARAQDHIFVAGAGNGFYGIFPLDNDVDPFYPASYDLDNIVAVAATDHNDVLASFSNYGATSVDLAAPGVNILSTVPGNGYESLSGTSMATPYVTGVIALVRDLHPDWSYDRVISHVLEAVDPVAALQGKLLTGGRLNAANAVVDDTSGPRVTEIPERVYVPLSSLTLTFDKAVDVATFSVDDIVTFTGPTGPVALESVNVVPGSRDRAFELRFPSQTDTGTYTIVIAPTLSDRNGSLLNQDGDETNGETIDDQFAAQFELVNAVARLDFGTTTTPVATGYRRVVETDVYAPAVGYGWQDNTMKSYDRAGSDDLLRDFHYAPQGTFLVDVANGRYEVVLSMGDAGALHDQMAVYLEGTQVDTVTTAAGQFAIKTHLVDVNDGQLTLQLLDLGGSNVNVVLNALEVIVAGPDQLGPQVIAVSPTGTLFGGTDRIVLTFNEAIDATSLDVSDVSLAGPAGAVTPLTVSRLSDVAYEVAFDMLSSAGTYQLRVGPHLTDVAGNLLDQDRDGSGGELLADEFTSSFTVETALRLDFGKATSPVAAGYQRVVETDVYAAGADYGWQDTTMKSFDRANGGDLLRDFHYAPQGTFLVDVPNRRYEVVLSMGDAGALHDQMAVFLEGTQVDTVTTAAGQFVTKTYFTDVNDGQLTLQLLDFGGTNANIVINALQVSVAGPDRLGPYVFEITSASTVIGAFDHVTLRFNEPLDVNSFSTSDLSLLGPGGLVTPLTLVRLSATTYEVAFAPQHDAGQYQLLVGPAITDTSGNLLDQNGNGIGGETPADQLSATINLETSLRLDFGKTTTPVATGYRRVVETDVYAPVVGYGWQDNTMKSYDRAGSNDLLRDFHYAPQGTFLVDVANGRYEVVLSMGDAGALHDQMAVYLEGTQVDTVTTASGQYAIKTHLVDVNDGQLTLQLLDLGGSNVNVVLNALEVIVAGPDQLGPQVIAVSPTGVLFGGTDRIVLTFNEAIDATSLDASDVSLTGPAGAVAPLTVSRLSDVAYEVAFDMLSSAGTYQLRVGPHLTDLAGNLLDQDRDGSGGELLADEFTSSFTVETALQLDFGKTTSPVAAGYRRVVETDVYAAGADYGWQDTTMKSYDRASGGDLLRDFHYAPQGTFLVDVPNRRYEVVLSMGDAGALHDQMAVFLEGTQVDTVTTAAGQFVTKTYFTDVLDGQLTLQLLDLGGTNANVVINALSITYQAGSAGSIMGGGGSSRAAVASALLSYVEIGSPWPRAMPYQPAAAPTGYETKHPMPVPWGQAWAGTGYDVTPDTNATAESRDRADGREAYFAELSDEQLSILLQQIDEDEPRGERRG